MRVMILSIATNDILAFDKPADHPDQPHPVQYCAHLISSDTGEVLEQTMFYIRPDGWEVRPEMVERHGVMTSYAEDHGVPEAHMVHSFLLTLAEAQLVAGFNIDFHLRCARTAMIRAGMSKEDADAAAKKIDKVDIMRGCTPICKLPPTDKMMARGIKTFKPPTLPEATMGVLGIETPPVHDAQVSVAMASLLYLHLNPPTAA